MLKYAWRLAQSSRLPTRGTMAIQTFIAGQTLTAAGLNALQNSDFNYVQNPQSGTSYTLTLTDKGKLINFNNAGSITLTIPTNASVNFTVGDKIFVLLASSGTLTIDPSATVTLASEGGIVVFSSQWTFIALTKLDTNTWHIGGGGGGTIQTPEIDDGAVTNAKVASNAAIALSKLATGTAATIVLHSSAGVPTATAVSGDVTISDTGVVAISSGTIVNADINASAAIDLGKLADVAIDTKTADYVLVLTDKNKVIEMNITTTANTVTVPLNATAAFPVGSQITIWQYGTGKTQIIPVSGTVTINKTPGDYLRARYSSATLIKRATNEWQLLGDLSDV